MIKNFIFKKELAILISIFILIISISSVSAEDNLILNNNEESYDLLIDDIAEYNDDAIVLDDEIVKDDDYVLESGNLSLYFRNGTKYSAKLTDGNGTGLYNKTIEFSINGNFYNRSTNTQGIAELAINLDPGNYTCTSTYYGSSNNLTSTGIISVLTTVNGTDVEKYYRNDSQFYASFYDGQGNPLKNKTVYFNINGVFYKRDTNENGLARLNINLDPNTYIITAEHPVSGLKMGYTIIVKPTIFAEDIEKYYRNDTQFYVTVIDGKGNPIINKNVSMNINGVFYNRTTNENGTARLNINLDPNTYVITAKHPETGLELGRLVEVLPTLITQDLKYELNYTKSFYVKVLDGEGKGTNGTVSVSVGGHSLTKVADENGTAMFNITAKSGTYEVLTSYNGYTVSNVLEVYRVTDGIQRINLGANEYGGASVFKSIGNKNSAVRIAFIIGVHPTENAVHQALYDRLLAQASKLNLCYDIYKINVNQVEEYSRDRMRGQLIGQEFVVPAIISTGYDFVIDIHSNEGTVGGDYLETNFVFAPLKDNVSVKYSDKIIADNPGLVQYFPESQTSPPFVTIPIAQAGIPTVIYEAYKFESSSITTSYIDLLIKSIETINYS
ncbi:carboxypeptidase regulatory-like domain-containing protein [Methanobrevibacter sp. DSM 116169]|uniref:carboxypeptidase regulatory-like domain-containing protein n=1 Tax=Methanobrevibacter sp. DSM 116169 TaxID=3242727 RepID=UPI0038FC3523